MFINYQNVGNRVVFSLRPTADEQLNKDRITLGTHKATIDLPYDVGRVHPDIMGLCAFLIAGPFATETLTFQDGISPQLADAFGAVKPNCKIGPVDHHLAPRARPKNGKPGLCFSGGADSTAALELLPAQTELFFHKRIAPLNPINTSYWAAFQRAARAAKRIALNRKSYHKSSAAGERFCEALQEAGHTAFVVGSDLEYVRNPVGFPHNISCSVPLLLMAESRNLDAIAWGTIGEAAYQFGSAGKYVDFATRNAFKHYNALLSTVGLPFLNPVVGLSEVATSRIALSSAYKHYIQSCQSGTVKPCGRCIKCFRKSLLDATVTGQWPSDRQFDRFFSDSDIARNLKEIPIKLENVYAFTASRYEGKHPIMLALKQRVRGGQVPVNWMTKYIPSYIEQAPPEYRLGLKEKLSRFLDPMSDEDLRNLQNWNVTNIGSDPQIVRYAKELKSLIESRE
ncbi:DUF6395 domain-containing protein [Microvirga sp. BSC39]|uniref:DUF6395 domain-containing protein n=1 Tax=Microvirga sp. BSC39 TaxID=1549810 RepID=UPI0004E8D0FA|nr:DUF6395 domain-containing protein [Microvirga sp. BSC39]KFG70230.1 hypothetical protein JH26_05715 [Microvirga sp. BSC39]